MAHRNKECQNIISFIHTEYKLMYITVCTIDRKAMTGRKIDAL